MTDETTGKAQETSLEEDIAKAFDEAEAGDHTKEEEEETKAKSDNEAGDQTDESDAAEEEKDNPDEEEAGEEDEGEQAGEDEEEEVEEEEDEAASTEAPEHWSEDDKTSFNELPDEAKPLFMEKVKSLESGYDQKFRALADDRKEVESYKGFADMFAPYEQQLQMAGTTPELYTRQLLATAAQLQANPRETLEILARQYGVELARKPDEGAGDETDEFYDPAISKLQAEVAGLSSKLEQSQQANQQASQNSFEQEWAVFANAKDDDGNETHPGAANLRSQMGAYLHANPEQSGETLQDVFARAYDHAKWSDPDLRKSAIEADAKTKEAARENERKADLKKAKKAGRTVKSKSAPVDEAPQPAETQREELERAWDAAVSESEAA